ncbi:MAG: hypothetical protein MI862_14740 [Desulfobacterales bacterium]|nr:hypothetical protein [Desulfobacterales bacterium]
MLKPLTTQKFGSYTKPVYLVRYDQARRFDEAGWRVDAEVRPEAFDDAVNLAVVARERAGASNDVNHFGDRRHQPGI